MKYSYNLQYFCPSRVVLGLGLAVVGAGIERNALALQPLDTFLAGVEHRNYDLRESKALETQRDAEVGVALGRLLPAFTARGTLTRNQYEAVATLPGANGTSQTLTITPQNQLDAIFQLDVPLIDVGGFYRYRAQKAAAEAQHESGASSRVDVVGQAVRGYYQVAGSRALIGSAKASVELAERSWKIAREKAAAGVTAEVDVERAVANLEQAKRDVATLIQADETASRALETLTGVTPDASTLAVEDDLREEEPLASWLARAGSDLPANRTAAALSRAADANKKAATLSLLPTLSAAAQERLTNATGFTGRVASYTLSATLSFRLDYTTIATANSQSAAHVVTQVRAERTQRAIQDQVYNTWTAIRAGLAKSKSARAQARATAHAAKLFEERYAAGAASQLDTLTAQRDAFAADVARVQADADLQANRALLRSLVDAPIAPLTSSTTRPTANVNGDQGTP